MKKLTNSQRTFTVLETLRQYTSENKRFTATDINRILAEKGFVKVDRKTIYEDLKLIDEMGYNIIKDNKTVYLDGAPFTYYEVKLLTDVVNSLSFLNSKDKKAINDKLYSSIDLEHAEFLKTCEFNGVSNKDTRPYYFLEHIYKAIFSQQTVVLTNKRGSAEIIPYTCVMNAGQYYLVYQYPGNKKLYTQRFDRIKRIGFGFPCVDERKRSFSDAEVKKYLKQSVGSYHANESYRVEIEVVNKNNTERIYDVLSSDFNDVVVDSNGHIYIDAIDAPTTYANLLKLGADIKIVPKKDYKVITAGYKKVLKNTLALY